MKKYSVHFMFSILAAALIILGACGSGDIIDISDRSGDEYGKITDGTDDVKGFIEYCGRDNTNNESCKVFIRSSSSEEESSSSVEELSSSSEEGEVSSSSQEELSSSSSSITVGSYKIPPFKCFWSPRAVKPGDSVQIKIEFEPPDPVAEADCDKEAWLGVNKPNTLGNLSDKYDTSYFDLDKGYVTSGLVLGKSEVQWPPFGEFKGDLPIEEISPNKNAVKIIGSTVTCENARAGKAIFSENKNCEPLFIGSIICNMTATTGTVGMPITPAPTASCNNTPITATDLTWTPSNLTPTSEGDLVVSVMANSGACSGMRADCKSISVSPPTLACNMTATTGTVGMPITPAPAATCNGTAIAATDLTWTPSNLTPTTEGDLVVSVRANSGVCSGMSADCKSISVSPPTLACSIPAGTTGTVGVPITTVPAVTCNGTDVTAGLTWTPANLTPVSSGNVAVSVTVGSGICSGITKPCGSVTVAVPPSSSSSTPLSSSIPSSSSRAPSSSSLVPSSSSVIPSSSSRPSSSSLVPSSSSSRPSSSSLAPSSSSSSAPSSSSAVLTCTNVPTTGTVGVSFARPTVRCNGSNITNNLTWTPNTLTVQGTNLTPTATGNIAVSVNVGGTGDCRDKTATCGSITVAAAELACNMTATTGTVGVPITPAPTVTCNGTAFTNNLTWTPSALTPTATGNVAVSVAVAGNGYCSGQTKPCGSVTVSSSSSSSSSSSTGGSGTCVGKTNIETYCPGIPWENVKHDNAQGNECIFVENISKWHDGNSYTDANAGMVNGVNFITMCGQSWGGDANKPCTDVLSGQNINPIDGGYYIYKFNGWNGNSAVEIGTPPNCNN